MTGAISGLQEAPAQHTATSQANTDLFVQTSEVNDLMVHYRADKGSISRFYSSRQTEDGGYRRGDNYNTPERRARLQQLNRNYLTLLDTFNFKQLSINGQVDYLLFKRNLNDALFELQEEQQLYQQISRFFPFSDKIYALEQHRRRGLNIDGEKVARELNEINKTLEKLTAQVKEEQEMDKKLAVFAEATANALHAALKNIYDFYNGYDPMFTWWVPKTYETTESSLNNYAALLKSKGKTITTQKDDGSGIIGVPIGRDELIRQLKLEYIPYSPEELVEIAQKEFAWCDAEMRKAAREMGLGDDWKAALEKLKTLYVAPGKQPEAMYDLYKQSVDFLKKHDLVTIPALAEESWRMIMMTPERQLVNPFFTGGEVLSISYPTNTMDYEQKMMSMRGNNPHFSRATVHHELIAGHHLQEYMSSRYKTYRHFSTPFWIEGNALYWEMLLWDLQFPRSPEDRVGMLFWRSHRCARIIFSLNYHLGKWTPQQCIDFLVDRVGHERANAEGEVRRSFEGSYSPLYQLAYMIGGLQLMALKIELVNSGKMSYKQYHDAIFHENELPIEMLRAILTNQSLTKDFTTQWRFYAH
ncbi:DUF885 family protein [Filimonas effusa]|uniref:DUF885 family protein n=1 Tax=Filimonas effusa TaxID=2508721 RepID=A0A4Q1D905_9BACT|nr:DUF885 family protein [Filimonas effusa]RXK85288.1 DUF885 family protein [Filimonas effusa]